MSEDIHAKIKTYKNRLLKKADAIIEEIEKEMEYFEKNYKKTHSKPDGYVLKENMTVYRNEKEAVENFRDWIKTFKTSNIKTVSEFKSKVLEELNRMYDNLTRIRVGIRMVMETVKSTFV